MLVVLATSVAISFVLTPLVCRVAWRAGAVSWPDGGRRLHHQPTALWGGLAVGAALLASVAFGHLLGLQLGHLPSLIIGAGLPVVLLSLLGCLDDLYNLPARWKLVGQIVATIPVVYAGFWIEQLDVFGFEFSLGLMGIPVTVCWLILGINAMNLLDGMDGMASTAGIVMSLAVAAIAATQGSLEIVVPALALAGALAGFLCHNRPPARIYLGDCGSMLLGFAVSFLVMRVSFTEPATAAVGVAVVLFSLPLLDTTLAIIRRALNGRSFMVADRGHIHHRLLDQGFSVWQVLGLVTGFCTVTGAVGWQAAVSGSQLWAVAVVGTIVALVVNRQLVGYAEWVLIRALVGQGAGIAMGWMAPPRWVRWLRTFGQMVTTPQREDSFGRGGHPTIITVKPEGLQRGAQHGPSRDETPMLDEEIREAA